MTAEAGLNRYGVSRHEDSRVIATRNGQPGSNLQWRLAQLGEGEMIPPARLDDIPREDVERLAKKLSVDPSTEQGTARIEEAFFGEAIERHFRSRAGLAGDVPEGARILNAFGKDTGPGRFTLQPLLVFSERNEAGQPRLVTAWRPGPGIHSCCAVDKDDCIARAMWWFDVTCRRESLSEGEVHNPYFGVMPEWRVIYAALCNVVLPITDEDYMLWVHWNVTDVSPLQWPDPYARHRERLCQARQHFEEYRRARAQP